MTTYLHPGTDRKGHLVVPAETKDELLRRSAAMLSAIAGDIEDGGSLNGLREKYVNALVNLRDDIKDALK